ncbi:MAG: hypothetical protein AVDCRST_MAG53-1561, partial [uncultured Solirubrobacteraceae bacterium]
APRDDGRHRGAARGGLGLRLRPGPRAPLHVRRDAVGGRLRPADGLRCALPDAHAGRLGRSRLAHRGRRVRRELRAGLDLADRHRPARAVAPARPRPGWGASPHPRRLPPLLRRGRRWCLGLDRRAPQRAAGPPEPAAVADAAQASGRAGAAALRRRRAPGAEAHPGVVLESL